MSKTETPDIVERLLMHGGKADIEEVLADCREAAAEIERLRESAKGQLVVVRHAQRLREEAEAEAILAMQAERRGDNTIQRDKIYRAAERSNTRFGQWIPERWVNIFVEEMSK